MVNLLTELISIILFLILCILLYCKYKYTHWKKKGIPYLVPSIPFGNVKDLILQKKSLGLTIADIYRQLNATGSKYGGYYMFAQPIFMVMDPELIKTVTIKEFHHFADRGIYSDEDTDPLSQHLFSITGKKWKHLRNKFSPTFTSGKMKMMFKTLLECSLELENVLEEPSLKGEPIGIKDILARYTTDIIGSCAFGLDCNSLKDPEAEFRRFGRTFFEPTLRNAIVFPLAFNVPKILKFFKIPVVKPELTKFFLGVIRDTINYREKNNIQRDDMMSLMIKLKNNENIDDEHEQVEEIGDNIGISFKQLAAQAFVFFLAGFETSSSVITFALYEIVLNEKIQNRMRKEIVEVLAKHNGELTYDAIMEMQYLDQVVSETLRKYPTLPMLNRECIKDFKIPGTDIVLDKGTGVVISVLGMHMNPEYYENPEIFDPERFSEKGKEKIIPYTYLPFGEGPRNCIGMRFGLLQVKVGLAVLLKSYKFSFDPKTKLPVQISNKTLVLSFEKEVWLQAIKI